jgi:hypothetical protein
MCRGPGTALPRDTLPVADRLRLIAAHAGSLAAQRPPEKRTFGTCRDYALMLCSMLRHRAVPTRVRRGFATYFGAAPYEDHWICEYWSPQQARWARADAQLDRLQRDHLAITFDCADLPAAAFLSGWQAWALARSAAAAATDFGHGDARGLWFLRVNLNRDLLALTNQHMSAWDTWRDSTLVDRTMSDTDLREGDRLADAIEAADRFDKLRELAAMRQVPPWRARLPTMHTDTLE